jgi:hypothetical protein
VQRCYEFDETPTHARGCARCGAPGPSLARMAPLQAASRPGAHIRWWAGTALDVSCEHSHRRAATAPAGGEEGGDGPASQKAKGKAKAKKAAPAKAPLKPRKAGVKKKKAAGEGGGGKGQRGPPGPLLREAIPPAVEPPPSPRPALKACDAPCCPAASLIPLLSPHNAWLSRRQEAGRGRQARPGRRADGRRRRRRQGGGRGGQSRWAAEDTPPAGRGVQLARAVRSCGVPPQLTPRATLCPCRAGGRHPQGQAQAEGQRVGGRVHRQRWRRLRLGQRLRQRRRGGCEEAAVLGQPSDGRSHMCEAAYMYTPQPQLAVAQLAVACAG